MVRLAVFDLDGTLISADSHVALLRRQWLRPGTANSLRLELLLGGVGWAAGVVPHRWTKEVAARALARVSADDMAREAEWVVSTVAMPSLRPSMLSELTKARAEGFSTVLLSASLQPMVEALGVRLGFDCSHGTQLGPGGLLDGPEMRGVEKARWLADYARQRHADLVHCRAYGDSAADRYMLERVGHPTAVCPDVRLRRLARARGWHIIDG